MTSISSQGELLATVSNEMVRLYKDQFGRGPTKARTSWVGPDTGRRVRSFVSGIDVDSDVSVEFFLLEPAALPDGAAGA